MLIFLSGCMTNVENENIQLASLQNIETIYVDYRSTNVDITSTDNDELKATLFLYDNGPAITMDEENGKINIRVNSDITRLFKIGRKPKLEI